MLFWVANWLSFTTVGVLSGQLVSFCSAPWTLIPVSHCHCFSPDFSCILLCPLYSFWSLLLIFLCVPAMLVAHHTVPHPSFVDFCHLPALYLIPYLLPTQHHLCSLPRRWMQQSRVNVGTCVLVYMAACPRRPTFFKFSILSTKPLSLIRLWGVMNVTISMT